mgnify:CR=1 FL=1|tara:strand:- start:690 stop:1229 length:540 start_codon:yes stop_codon:yes gene_type:complete
MSDPSPTLRDAIEVDFAEIAEIYAHYVLNGLASFEITPPDLTELKHRWQSIQDSGLPYLVIEQAGKIGGYAYASQFRPRPAYNNTVEDSVYVSPNFLGQGLGKILLTDLIEKCTSLGLRQMVAVIGDSKNHPSINLHKKLGFAEVGVMPSTGFKLNQWVDTVIMQRTLGDGDASLPLLK